MGERSIPHLRDIFGVPFDGIQHSPRSRRRGDLEFRGDACYNEKPPEPATDPDSAVSVGSSGEEENYHAHKKKHIQGKGRSSRKEEMSGSRTLTQRDVRHLERHLSMKKTIRKKIMRDLRQAFVEDPSDFDPSEQALSPDQLREINLQNLRLNGDSDANFLEILRTDKKGSRQPVPDRGCAAREDDRDSGHGSPTRDIHRFSSREEVVAEEESGKKSFWKRFTLKGRNSKR